MKRTLYLLWMLMAFRVQAQVTMTPQLPSGGVLLKAQLWNVVLVSGSQVPVGARVAVRLMDATTNQPVLTGISNEIMLTRGARQLQASDLGPIQYEYLSTSIDRSPTALLPAGNYLACYSLSLSDNKQQQQFGDDCIPFVVEPVSPPLLNMPSNESLLEERYPQFTWLPPVPASMFSDLNYDMVITRVREGQSPQEAVQQNIPVYRGTYLKNMFVNYPPAAAPLDTGVTYAWTVTARNGKLFAAQTEVWTFRMKNNVVRPEDNNDAFVRLRMELDAAMVHVSGTLKVAYVNMSGEKEVRYELLSLKNNKVIDEGKLPVVPGENYLVAPLKKRMQDGEIYLFRIENSRGEHWQIKLTYSAAK
ncbi:hypothetical protein CLV59_109252 [Chitinophaga dinghuensis]|uniref:Uncharacterized protein n=1 Tax=Chitinophaga dinghuensis TaxID=1539050 RepID=A0A327VQ06_9BACT|nr:hypothetical protein [Chitinophaga dinghuensis]RAJ75638.1 hypothetical protein CLV59_109252 [Chitinophaga dinghuensis]